jgi:hypothetical protein
MRHELSFAVLIILLSCVDGNDGKSEGSTGAESGVSSAGSTGVGSASPTSTSEGATLEQSTSSMSGTTEDMATTGDQPLLLPDICATLDTPEDCGSVDQPAVRGQTDGFACTWLSVLLAQRRGDVCEVEHTHRCVPLPVAGLGGCMVPPECSDASPYVPPFYSLESDGRVALATNCSPVAPHGWTWCLDGSADGADPAECACACELWSDPGSTGSSGG